MAKESSKISSYLIWIGLTILISSSIFIYYHLSFVAKNDYQLYISNLDASIGNYVNFYCVYSKFENASVNVTECFDENRQEAYTFTQRFMPSYDDFLKSNLFSTVTYSRSGYDINYSNIEIPSDTAVLYVIPLLLGASLIVIGFVGRRLKMF